MADTTLPGLLARGDHASRPAATAVGSGALYGCTDHSLIYQSDGATWSTWLDVSGTGSIAAHVGDTSDAHDASAVSFDDTGLAVVTAPDVQAAIVDLDTAVNAHVTDAVAAHAATAVSFDDTGLAVVTATEVQAAIADLDAAVNAHVTDATDAHDASAVSFDPTGLDVVAGTEVQTAIEELDAGVAGLGAASLVFIIDGGGDPISTGSKGHIEVPFACTITAWRILSDQSGSIVVDVKKAAYSGLPTTTSIAASAKPTLSSAQKNENTTLTGWTTSVSAGDWLEFVVDSASTVERVTVVLRVTR